MARANNGFVHQANLLILTYLINFERDWYCFMIPNSKYYDTWACFIHKNAAPLFRVLQRLSKNVKYLSIIFICEQNKINWVTIVYVLYSSYYHKMDSTFMLFTIDYVMPPIVNKSFIDLVLTSQSARKRKCKRIRSRIFFIKLLFSNTEWLSLWSILLCVEQHNAIYSWFM